MHLIPPVLLVSQPLNTHIVEIREYKEVWYPEVLLLDSRLTHHVHHVIWLHKSCKTVTEIRLLDSVNCLVEV